MSYIQIEGGRALEGSIVIQGSKNAALPILSAALLHEGTTTLTHVPDISDVKNTLELLKLLGCQVEREGHRVTVHGASLRKEQLPRTMVEQMRSSFLLAGALLGRLGQVETFYPGGCVIGARPIDLHLMGFARMGVRCITQKERIVLEAREGLHGVDILLPYPSVGATENLLLASVRAEGITYLHGAAKEPEIDALIACLQAMGADIHYGVQPGSTGQLDKREIVIRGVKQLRDCLYEIPGDRIVAGTLLAALGVCRGNLRLKHIKAWELTAALEFLKKSGMELQIGEDGIDACMNRKPEIKGELVTGPFPAFPTDLQAIFMAMMSASSGHGSIQETVFESRFRHVEQLRKMGAAIQTEGEMAYVIGKDLYGSTVEAQDLRAGAALVVAGLAAKGTTLVERAEYIDRGYEDLAGNLHVLGAKIHQMD